jgi:hypothetical protein
MPSNKEFASYISRKSSGGSKGKKDLKKGISEETHLKLMKFFEDLVVLEGGLERKRN